VFALVQELGLGAVADLHTFAPVFQNVVGDPGDHIMAVAEIAGNILGYAVATISHPLYTRGDSAHLQELVVSPGASGRGVGSNLVDWIERECIGRGVTQLTVSILRGAGFYERLGYRSTSDYLKKSFLLD
jgi:GNAT superfamily N-acetyltransferase